MLVVLTMCLCATVASAQVPPIVVTQVNWLNNLQGGGALASGNAAGSTMGVNSATGDMIVSTTYGNKVLDINVQTGAETVLVDWGSDIGQNYNVGPIALDSNNNLYVGGLYTNNVIKIPFVSGAYVAAPYPATAPANCTGSDTAECNFGSNLTNSTNGWYFGIQSMTFDAAGDFFFSLTNANTAPEAIYECTVACLATGTPAATIIYMEPVSVVAAQYMVGGMAVDPWGNLFFTDSNYNGSKNESLNSEVNELMVSAGAGYGGATTGYAAAPTVLYTETDTPPGSYDDEIDAVAVDALSGTVYFADQYNGVFAFPNNSGTVNPADMYTVSQQGAKILALDAMDNLYGAVYVSDITSGGADTAFQATVNTVLVPGLAGIKVNGVTPPASVLVGNSADTSYNVNAGSPAVLSTGSYVAVLDNATTCAVSPTIIVVPSGADSSEFSAEMTAVVPPATALLDSACNGTMSGGASYPMTVTFTPSAGGMQTATLTVTDAVLNSGTATANGVGLALIPQTVTITSPASGPVVYGVAPITVTATSNSASGIPVVLSIDNSSTAGAGTLSGTASGSMLTINGVGTIIIDANQAGNSTYAQATEAQITITVTQAPQAITFAPTSPIMFTTTPIALAATGGGSGNPVTFTVTSGPGAITGTAAAPTLTLSNIGTVVVAANEAGSANYLAAPTVTKSIVVNVIGQVAEPSFSIASGTYYGSANKVTLSTATAGATIYYTIGGAGTTPTTSSTKYTGAIPLPKAGDTYVIEALAVELGYTNSEVATAKYVISAGVPDFTFSLGASALALTAGDSGTMEIVVKGSPDTAPFVANVKVTCAGLPRGATCSALTITPNGTPVAKGTLTITAGANSYIARSNSSPLIPGTALATALCCFLGFKKRRRLQMLLVLAVSAIGLGLFTGCGPQWTPTFSVSSVKVQAESTVPPVVKTAILTLTVNK
ncbi:MAG: chitobiase/beta-hexosaminidase C-terminal domain-containing protein [Bryobacteraceae bacterium]